MKIKFDLVWEWPKPISWLWSNWHHFFFPLHKPLSTTKSRKIPSMGGGRKIADIRCQTKRQSTQPVTFKRANQEGGIWICQHHVFHGHFVIGSDSSPRSAFYLDVNIMWKLGHFPRTIYSRFAELESPINILLPEIKIYWERHSGQLSLYFCHYSNNKDFLMLSFSEWKFVGKSMLLDVRRKIELERQ